MDTILYPELKALGNAKLERLAPGAFDLTVKQFERYTGRELAPEHNPCDHASIAAMIGAVEKALSDKQRELAALHMIAADMAALEAPNE